MPFVHRLRVRYNECDPQGHVFNANYVVYLDVAVTELWRAALGSYGALLELGLDLVVAEIGLRFRAPAHFDDELDVELVIGRLGTTAIGTELTVRRQDTTVVEGEVRHVCVEAGSTTKAPLSDELRAALEPFAS